MEIHAKLKRQYSVQFQAKFEQILLCTVLLPYSTIATREPDAGHQLGQGHRLHRHRDGQSQPPVCRGI